MSPAEVFSASEWVTCPTPLTPSRGRPNSNFCLVVIVPWNGPLFQNVALLPVCGPFLAAARLLTLIRSLPGACLAPGTSGLQTWEGPPVVFPASPSCSFLPRFSGPWGRGSSPRVAHPVSTLSPRSHSWKGRGCPYCLGCSRASPRSGWFCGPAAVTGDHRAESDGLCSPHRGICLVPDTSGRHSSQVPWPVALGPNSLWIASLTLSNLVT